MSPAEPRVNAAFAVHYAVGRSHYSGTIVNISRSGVLAVAEHYVPDVGTRLHLSISGPRDHQIELDARVVRRTEHGFAAEFLGTPVELLELVADLGV